MRSGNYGTADEVCHVGCPPHTRVLVQILAPPLSVQLPANVSWQTEDDDSSAWAPAIHMGDLEKDKHSSAKLQ